MLLNAAAAAADRFIIVFVIEHVFRAIYLKDAHENKLRVIVMWSSA